MAKQFLNLTGLITLLSQLKTIFATTSEIAQVETDTDTYVLNIDYESLLAFDTTQIVGDVGQFDLTTFENFVLT